MSEQSSLHERIAALERSLASRQNRWRGWRTVAILALVVLCGLISVQVWLIFAQFDHLRESETEHLFWVVCRKTGTRRERTQAFLKLVERRHTEWRSAHLKRLELQGVDLSGASLQVADFEAADLSESRLVAADLTLSSLRLADLTKVDLSSAGLAEADLLKAKLDAANFRSANLRAASLEQVRARSAVFVLADLSDATLLLADLSDADLTGANLRGADLESTVLRGCQLGLTNLTGAILRNTDFTDSNWWRARGLTTEQIAEFREKFPPGKDADASKRNDYELWLKSLEAAE